MPHLLLLFKLMIAAWLIAAFGMLLAAAYGILYAVEYFNE